ncbi:MAG: hypothetical protein EHM93_05530 [Bacteroidales bacterium]|nr:MAG: hypothetical protein EHM93_05530 [Bacteroidales bacterium]
MKKISLSEVEVNDLLDLYQSEIDRAQRRINSLKSIVKKISEGNPIDITEEKPAKVETKRGRKTKAKKAIAKVEKEITIEPKKRGRKPIVKAGEIEVEPKKRGRKPKVKAVEVKNAKEVAKKPIKKAKKEKVATIKAEPKKRGRKPKVVIPNALITEEKKEIKVIERVKKPKSKTVKKKVIKVKAEPKKKGRKPKSLRKPIKGGKGKDKVKWNDFINETLTVKDSLMLASSITQAALEKFDIPANDRDRVRMAISTTLTKMANKDKVLHTYTQTGIRGAFFGLAKWFDDKGELNNDYKKKLM